MSQDHHVTICVPVYNGRDFVGETLAAIQRQSHENLTVLISDDASDDGSPDVCRPFTRDSRFHLEVQPARRGWIENCNWLLAKADSEFLCIQPHDDLPDPDYIARLVACLAAAPECILAFTDVQVFGLRSEIYRQDSIRGSAAERVRAFIANHYDGTAWRGLIRQQGLEITGVMRATAMDNFAADVTWLARLAQAGEFRRIAQPLYRKRRHVASASMRWGHWSDETKAKAWCSHCCELLRDALGLALTPGEQSVIVRAALRRALAIEPALPFGFIRGLPRSRQSAMVAAVLAQTRHGATTNGLAEQDPDAMLARLLSESRAGTNSLSA